MNRSALAPSPLVLALVASLLFLAILVGAAPAHAASSETSEGSTQIGLAPGQSAQWQMSSEGAPANSRLSFRITRMEGALFEGAEPATVRIEGIGDEDILLSPGNDLISVSLGDIAVGETIILRATANMPLAAGDEYRNAQGTVAWQFQYEQASPHALAPTGMAISAGVMLAAAAVIVAGAAVRSSRRRQRAIR